MRNSFYSESRVVAACEHSGCLMDFILTYKNVFFAALFAAFLFFAVLFLLPGRTADASNDSHDREYRIASVQIQSGDTLWAIAEQYYTKEFSTIRSYVKEIKRMNGMQDDVLYAGGYILVPYYTTAEQ